MFRLDRAGFRYGSKTVLRDITLDLTTGVLTAVAGPNGAGKSTLIHVLSGLRQDYSGSCTLQGKEVREWDRKSFARIVSVVPQSIAIEFPFTVEQVVLMGRNPHCDRMFESVEDHELVRRAMEQTDTSAFAGRDFRSLSGGEKQRVIIAAALAQQPRALLLDEPTAFLDLQHQVALWRLIRELTREGLLVAAVTHELNLAATYADRVVLLHDATVAADGSPAEVLDAEKIRQVFRVTARVETGSGRPWIRYAD